MFCDVTAWTCRIKLRAFMRWNVLPDITIKKARFKWSKFAMTADKQIMLLYYFYSIVFELVPIAHIFYISNRYPIVEKAKNGFLDLLECVGY